jgi:predicted nucleic acid-binding protein
LDTSIFIYEFEQYPRYFTFTDFLFHEILAGRATAVTSVVTLMELTVLPLRQHRPAVARTYELALTGFPGLRVAPVTRTIARTAGELRADYRLSAPDALQVATVLQHGATALVTNDLQLRRLSPLLDVFLLDDFTTV